eukprot:TRINITY_DN41120_c0_g1_i1.p1 TRINITY_DN41120_c0_g1~~TRINITY_DN41120_c0_g1_i1.p1  ORF type:complete len:811 (+),score=89.05 TRINITY_DN41120_c0_g1_i1:56-2488(+)
MAGNPLELSWPPMKHFLPSHTQRVVYDPDLEEVLVIQPNAVQVSPLSLRRRSSLPDSPQSLSGSPSWRRLISVAAASLPSHRGDAQKAVSAGHSRPNVANEESTIYVLADHNDTELGTDARRSPCSNFLAVARSRQIAVYRVANPHLGSVLHTTLLGLHDAEKPPQPGVPLSVKGLFWVNRNVLLVIWSTGSIELLRAHSEKRKLGRIKHIESREVDEIAYSARHHILVTRDLTQDGVQCWRVGESTLHTVNSTPVDARPGHLVQLHLVELYDHLYLVSVDEWRNQAALYSIAQNSLELHSSVCLPVVDAPSTWSGFEAHVGSPEVLRVYRLNVVDNLLVIHHCERQASWVFDPLVLSPANTLIAVAQQSLAVPIGSLPPGVTPTMRLPSNTMAYSHAVVSHHLPDLILSPSLGLLFQLRLTQQALLDAAVPLADRVPFLLRRTRSRSVLLATAAAQIRRPSPSALEMLTRCFASVNSVYAHYLVAGNADACSEEDLLPESKAEYGVCSCCEPLPASGAASPPGSPNATGKISMVIDSDVAKVQNAFPFLGEMRTVSCTHNCSERRVIYNGASHLVVTQADFVREVFTPLAREQPSGVVQDNRWEQHWGPGAVERARQAQQKAIQSRALRKHRLRGMLEYIRSLVEASVEPSALLQRCLIELLLEPPAEPHLLQEYVQYHVIEDSITVAFRLLAAEQVCPAAGQLAVDMLYRLGAHDEIVRVLASRGDTIKAVEIMVKYRTDAVVPCSFLFQKAWAAGMPVFLTVAQLLIQYETSRRNAGEPGFRLPEDCEAFRERYESLLKSTLLAEHE